jgi:hypothetical protein
VAALAEEGGERGGVVPVLEDLEPRVVGEAAGDLGVRL